MPENEKNRLNIHRWVCITALLFGSGLCWGVAVPPGIETTFLGDPPIAPPPAIGFASPAEITNSTVISNTIYLPIILRQEPYNPSFNIHDRYSMRYFYNLQYNVATPPSGWNGDIGLCNPGDTSAEFKAAVLQRINYFRLMAGIPPLTGLNVTFNQNAQAAALMMSANNTLNHNPPPSWKCYTDAGKQGAGSSNLCLGRYGPAAVSGYIQDPGSSNTALGHRRWILYPQTQEMGTGDINPPNIGSAWISNALYVFDSHMWEARPATRDEFVSWPPAGYVPYPVVFARWSLAYPLVDFSGASVSMSSGGSNLPVTMYSPVNGYGENTLGWIISGMSDSQSWPQPSGDTTYTVTIQNVVLGGSPRTFTYDVIIFNPAY